MNEMWRKDLNISGVGVHGVGRLGNSTRNYRGSESTSFGKVGVNSTWSQA